jgi:diguanylate cyclase (GGDEF)-like protein/PAS domain S-box-containing protein
MNQPVQERPTLTTRFSRLSLKTKLIALMVGLFMTFLWLLTFFAVTVLQSQFERVLSDEQYASTRRLAAELDSKLRERIDSLSRVSPHLPQSLDTATLDHALAQFGGLHIMFSGGIAVLGLDGKVIADYPTAPGRHGTWFGDRDYFRKTVETQKPYIDKPVIGRVLKRPVLTIGVPVFDGEGRLRAVMTGITDLTAPNFLGVMLQPAAAGKGELLVVSPRDNLIVASSDPAHMLTPPPARGINPLYDRFADGFEGSGVSTSSRGVPNLYSAVRVPTSNWLVMATLPTAVAFGPVKAMQEYLYVLTAGMTLLALVLIWWATRRMFARLDTASSAMRRMTGGLAPLTPLPAAGEDEVGQLIGNFNLLVEDRQRYETALRENERWLSRMIESAPDAIFVQAQGRFAYINGATLRLFGAGSREQLQGRPLLERVHADYRQVAESHMRMLNEKKTPVPLHQEQFLQLDGTPVDVELSAVPFHYENQDGALMFARDITERARAEQTQKQLNRALRLLSDCNMALMHAEREQSLLDEICRLVVHKGGYRMAWVGYAEPDADKTVRVVSQCGANEGYLEQIRISWADTEYGRGTVGTAIRTGRLQVNQNFCSNPVMAPWREEAAKRGFQSNISLPLMSENRAYGTLTIYSADPESFAEAEVRLLYELASDLAFGISTLRTRVQREAAEEKLAFLAHYDPLTRLPNRVLLRDRFERALGSATRDHAGVALLFLDLDNFKQVNEGLGHEVGDQLLLRVVERLQRCIRDTDTVSRQGGDEFVVLLPSVRDTSVVSRAAQAILDATAEPFEIGAHTVSTTFSIGISMYPNDGADFDTLLKNADTALYHAKDNGRDTYHFFTATMNVDALARMELHSNLRKAVKNGEFVLHYQPQVELGSGRIVGAEALVRWRRADEELVPPGRFIPLAEESGLIVQIGEWVLNEACRQAKAWIDEGMAPMPVAVNLSAQQFKRGDILETVARALDESGLPPALLELELTETILLQETGVVMETLHRLKKLGVQLSIDDFGTGYSSLAYLKKLAVDKLKIDQSFVRDLAHDADDAAIVKAVIQLGHAMQLTVIAEGVETADQRDFLRRYGCDQIQGYLLSHPLPASEFAEFAASLA